ncbi:MAG: hypothetical protein KA764_17455 [Anaerolineales bacterium]|nr:hypothetical protein [Anaerolineales bacterium]
MNPRPPRRRLVEQPYLNVELHGRRGLAWYVEDGGVLYAQLPLPANPEWWLRPAPEVNVTPSDARGRALGQRLAARARLAWDTEAERARQLLRTQTPWLRRRWAALRAWLKGERLAWVVVQLSAGAPLTAARPGKNRPPGRW